MTVMGVRAARATATAVFPTPVGPTITGVGCRESGAAEPALKLFLRQLNHRWPSMHVVRWQRGAEEPNDQLTHLSGLERLTSLDRRATRIRRRKALEPVLPSAETAPSEVGDELLQATGSLETGMGVGGGVDDDAASRERLDLVTDAHEQLAMRLDSVELRRREIEREWQEQPLRRRAVTGELAHDIFVQDALVRGVLIHDADGLAGLEDDVGVEELEDWSRLRSAVSRQRLLGEELQRHTDSAEGRGLMADSTHRCRRIQRCKRRSHRLLNHLLHKELVAKPRLELRRMHVHVDGIAGKIEEQEERRTIAGRDRGAVAGLRGSQNEGIANRPAPHKDVAFAPRRPRLRRSLREAGHFERAGSMRHFEQR